MANYCLECLKRILSHSRTLKCTICEGSVHVACNNTSRDEAEDMVDWICIYCMQQAMPFYNIVDEDCLKSAIYEQLFEGRLDFEELNEKNISAF